MSDIEESIKKIIEKMPWLEEPITDLRVGLGTYQKNMQDLYFRVSWLESYTIRIKGVVDTLLNDDQKNTDEYQSLTLSIHQHIKRFSPDLYEKTLIEYKKMVEDYMIKLNIHPEEEIEKYRKLFPLEDLPKIITYDFVKTHFGDEQLEIYRGILKDDQ